MPYLYAKVHIPTRKDDFVLCMVNGSAMHLNGVTATIALKSGKWGLFTQFLLSLILGVYASHYETKQKQT